MELLGAPAAAAAGTLMKLSCAGGSTKLVTSGTLGAATAFHSAIDNLVPPGTDAGTAQAIEKLPGLVDKAHGIDPKEIDNLYQIARNAVISLRDKMIQAGVNPSEMTYSPTNEISPSIPPYTAEAGLLPSAVDGGSIAGAAAAAAGAALQPPSQPPPPPPPISEEGESAGEADEQAITAVPAAAGPEAAPTVGQHSMQEVVIVETEQQGEEESAAAEEEPHQQQKEEEDASTGFFSLVGFAQETADALLEFSERYLACTLRGAGSGARDSGSRYRHCCGRQQLLPTLPQEQHQEQPLQQ